MSKGLPKKEKRRNELNWRQAKFVAEYMKDANAKQAAIRAGYSPQSASVIAYDLLHNHRIKKMMEEVRSKITTEGAYNYDSAMKEIEENIEFAKNNKGVNAIPRLLELKMKLNGLLVERHDIRVQQVDVAEALREANARVHGEVIQEVSYRVVEDEDDLEEDLDIEDLCS